SVFLQDDVSDAQRSEIETVMKSLPGVESIAYESKEQAFQRFKEIFKNQADLVENVSPSSLPASLRVTLKEDGTIQPVREALANKPGVDRVVENVAGSLVFLPGRVSTEAASLARAMSCPGSPLSS
ncbi:MAG TPA: permease-like cell division protein FtsX, partial [Actinomycetota bacterium]|nr:permease-like cell division protein FtsX [Actinomycetota bacterium]